MKRAGVGLALVFAFVANTLVAETASLSKSFPPGEGAKFSLVLDKKVQTEVTVYAVGSQPDSVAVECYFNAAMAGFPVEMWQQTVFHKKGASIDAGEAFLLSTGMKRPQKFSLRDVVGQSGGLNVGDFLMVDAAALAKFRVGEEVVETEAGTIKAVHYRQQKGPDQLDYWISDQAKPLGIARITSKGKNNFELSLKALVKNVAGKIDPKQAEPLGNEGKMLLNIPGLKPLN